MTVLDFRESLPQFSSELFSDAKVSFYLKLAAKQLDKDRWGDWWIDGCFMHAAHNLTLDLQASKDGSGTGGIAAVAGAVVSTSKTVGGVSVSETKAGSAANVDPAAGEYSLTWYGQKYWQMSRLIGSGGLQL